MIKLFLFTLIGLSFGVELKWTAKEKALIKKVKDPNYFIELHQEELRDRSKASIGYVLEAFSKLDVETLKSSREQIPMHRFNDWEERQMMIREAGKLVQFEELEEE